MRSSIVAHPAMTPAGYGAGLGKRPVVQRGEIDAVGIDVLRVRCEVRAPRNRVDTTARSLIWCIGATRTNVPRAGANGWSVVSYVHANEITRSACSVLRSLPKRCTVSLTNEVS